MITENIHGLYILGILSLDINLLLVLVLILRVNTSHNKCIHSCVHVSAGEEYIAGQVNVTVGGDQLTRCHLDSAKPLDHLTIMSDSSILLQL
jgi:hypothetical protein